MSKADTDNNNPDLITSLNAALYGADGEALPTAIIKAIQAGESDPNKPQMAVELPLVKRSLRERLGKEGYKAVEKWLEDRKLEPSSTSHILSNLHGTHKDESAEESKDESQKKDNSLHPRPKNT